MGDDPKAKIAWLPALKALLLLDVVDGIAAARVTSDPTVRVTEAKEAIPQVAAPSSTKMGAPNLAVA